MNTAPLSSPALNPLLSMSALRPANLYANTRDWFAKMTTFDLAMDLGTANVLIYAKRRGILLNQPSVVAIDERTHKVIAVGQDAKSILGRTGQTIKTFRPLQDGVIANFEMASAMIRQMLSSVCKRFRLIKPRIVIGVPSGITQVERRAVIDAALWSGVREVFLIEESMAAAIGAGIDVANPAASMIVDIGGGTTEVAVVGMNHIHHSFSLRCAGDEMDRALCRYVNRNFGVTICEAEAERAKLSHGSALPGRKSRSTILNGKDTSSGMPTRLEITDQHIRDALEDPLSAITTAIYRVLENTEPEVARDVLSSGIALTGGGALLSGLDRRLQGETGIRFKRVRDPLSCVVRGVGQVVEEFKKSRCLCLN